MAYSDVSGKIITRVFGKFRGTAYVAVVPGNLLARDTTNEGWILADESDASVAEAVAVETIAAGAEGWMALACEIKAPPTIATGGVVTAGALAIAADVCDALYLDDDGLASDTEGSTTVQQVGFILSTERALLMPNVGITGTAISSTTLTTSGNATVGGALAVTGTSTLTGAVAINGGATVASGKNLTMTKGNVLMTEGNVAFTKGQVLDSVNDGATGAATLDATDTVTVCELSADTTLTLPTAVAGQHFTVVHKSGDYVLTVKAGTSDKIIDPADGGVHDTIYDDKGLDCHISLVAADDTNWVCTSLNGGWAGAD
jgi:hypothetical protein